MSVRPVDEAKNTLLKMLKELIFQDLTPSFDPFIARKHPVSGGSHRRGRF
jgi:hypothetical protein